MPNYTIDLRMPAVAHLSDAIRFELLAQAVAATANELAFNWAEAIKAAPIWDVERQLYLDSIKITKINNLRYEVSSDYPVADLIEMGRPARDLKRMLDTSTKVRRTKDGRRFLIIPFRTNTPSNTAHAPAMSRTVYDLAKAMKPSEITGTGVRPAGQDTILSPGSGMRAAQNQTPFLSDISSRSTFLVPNQTYKWGDRLTRKMLREGGASEEEQKRLAGMVRMAGPKGKSAGYLTFRTLMEGSSGWVVPAKSGLYIARDVVDHLAPIAEQALNQAAAEIGGTSDGST